MQWFTLPDLNLIPKPPTCSNPLVSVGITITTTLHSILNLFSEWSLYPFGVQKCAATEDTTSL